MSAPRATAKEWDEIRKAFAGSIMIDTQITSLAQNLDGADWPMKGKDETPSKYVDLTFAEVQEMLVLKGQPTERFDQLIAILRETLAFDDPFGDMVEQTAESTAKDNTLLKNLTKLGIPGDFPIKLTALNSDTLEFCRLENSLPCKNLRFLPKVCHKMSSWEGISGSYLTLFRILMNPR
jgi:hypothetical protein